MVVSRHECWDLNLGFLGRAASAPDEPSGPDLDLLIVLLALQVHTCFSPEQLCDCPIPYSLLIFSWFETGALSSLVQPCTLEPLASVLSDVIESKCASLVYFRLISRPFLVQLLKVVWVSLFQVHLPLFSSKNQNGVPEEGRVLNRFLSRKYLELRRYT